MSLSRAFCDQDTGQRRSGQPISQAGRARSVRGPRAVPWPLRLQKRRPLTTTLRLRFSVCKDASLLRRLTKYRPRSSSAGFGQVERAGPSPTSGGVRTGAQVGTNDSPKGESFPRRRCVLSSCPLSPGLRVRTEDGERAAVTGATLTVYLLRGARCVSETANERKQSHRSRILLCENPRLDFRLRFVPR